MNTISFAFRQSFERRTPRGLVIAKQNKRHDASVRTSGVHVVAEVLAISRGSVSDEHVDVRSFQTPPELFIVHTITGDV